MTSINSSNTYLRHDSCDKFKCHMRLEDYRHGDLLIRSIKIKIKKY